MEKLELKLTAKQKKLLDKFVIENAPPNSKWSICGTVVWPKGVVRGYLLVGLEVDAVDNALRLAYAIREERKRG